MGDEKYVDSTYIADDGSNEGTDITYHGTLSSDLQQSRNNFNDLIVARWRGVGDTEPFQ
jgi:hypothetical protein